MDTIRHLASLRGRWPGSEDERQAAEYVAGEVRRLGRKATLEPVSVRPSYALTYAIHAALAVVGNVVAVYSPPLGVLILLLASLSMFGDLTARFHLLRRLMARRWSRNVTSAGTNPAASATVVLTAHYDSARSGLIFAHRRRPLRLLRRLRSLAGPIDLVFWTMIAALAMAVVRLLAGFGADEATALTIAQFVATVVLMVAFTLFIDVALSEPVPGANDNASGVAAVLEVGRRLDTDPPANLNIWLVFPGAKEGIMLGMREWMRAHHDELDPRRTFFVNVDNVGTGRPRVVGAEGYVIIYQHDARLIQLAASLLPDDDDRTPLVWRLGTDGVVPAMRGFPSVTICCTDEYGRIPNFHRQTDDVDRIEAEVVEDVADLTELLVRRIDSDLVPSMLPSLEPVENGH
jgi:peptidase M28-like protein